MVSKLLFLFLLTVLCAGLDVNKLKLKQVLIFSRHNVRFPLGQNLQRYAAKPMPLQAGERGKLTPRGALLEGYMGEYFSQWFRKEEFLPEECPDEETVYVYANTYNRTRATARAFLDSAFKSCNVTVHHKNTEEPDPLFEPVIRNTTEEYKENVFHEIHSKLDNHLIKSQLKTAFGELNTILDIARSDVCKEQCICDLNEANDTIFYEVGKEMWVYGPLFIGVTLMDSFTMSYYNGLPLQDIAWGQIDTPEKWRLLTAIGRQDHYIRYTTVAEDIAAPLMDYLTTTFKNLDTKPKLTLIVGHDYNMNTISTCFGFQPIDLPEQNERFPIGGKFVFQRWTDGVNDYLKTEFVYASWSQLREGTVLSLDTPPQRVSMRLNWCNTDGHDFCPWNEFVNKL